MKIFKRENKLGESSLPAHDYYLLNVFLPGRYPSYYNWVKSHGGYMLSDPIFGTYLLFEDDEDATAFVLKYFSQSDKEKFICK